MSEKPVHSRLRRLVDWINLTGAKKVHSLIDKVYKRKNLEMAWEKVKANRGSGGVDGQTLEAFEAQLNQQLERLQRELKEDSYQPLPVRQHPIPKRDKPGEYRMLGIPAIYDRVCQQALLNRLEPIFEPLFDDASFGYRSSAGNACHCNLGAGARGFVGNRMANPLPPWYRQDDAADCHFLWNRFSTLPHRRASSEGVSSHTSVLNIEARPCY